MNERPHVETSWNAVTIPDAGAPLLPESGCADPLRRKEIGSMSSVPFSVF